VWNKLYVASNQAVGRTFQEFMVDKRPKDAKEHAFRGERLLFWGRYGHFMGGLKTVSF
jgi:hypothetical protein